MPKPNNVHNLVPDVAVPCSDETHAVNTADELKFREALDTLVEVFSTENILSSKKISSMMDVGLAYLAMPSAILGSAMGNSLEVLAVAGSAAQRTNVGDNISITDTMCLQVLDSDTPIAIHNSHPIAGNEISAELPRGVHSYIGTQIVTSNGPLGTLSFFSETARVAQFNHHEIRIIQTIANLAGTIIGNDEKVEFLSHQNDYYRSLFSTVPSMMMLCNEDGLILSTSDRLCTELGIEPLKLPGQSCQKYFEQKDTDILSKSLRKGEFEHLPLTLCRSNGERLEVELNSTIKAIGSMRGVRMIVLSDVSERNKAMKSVEEQNKQLALVNQSLNQFAFIASHDLQEPLRKIQQFSHFLEEDLGDGMTRDGQYHLNVIVNSAQRMSTLIQDLLEFSSAAKDDLVVSDIPLSTLLKEVCSELELRIEETNAQVIVSDLPTIKGDRSLIRQLFTNLVGNSLKYRDENRDPIVKVDVKYIDENLAITVTDNGIGFDQKLAARAFEPFSRLHTSKDYKGNGIGLSICSTVCEKHNWELSASSEPGIGSKFTILIVR